MAEWKSAKPEAGDFLQSQSLDARFRKIVFPQMRLYDSWVRLTLVAALAEGEESGVGVVEGGLTAFIPPALPFPLEEIHVIVWCN